MKVQPCKVTRGGNSNSNESAAPQVLPYALIWTGRNKKSEWQAVGAFDFWTNADETRVRPSRILLYKRGNLQDDFGWLPCISASYVTSYYNSKRCKNKRAKHVQNYKTVLINAHKQAHFILFFLDGGDMKLSIIAQALNLSTLFWAYRGLAHKQLFTRPITKKGV